MILDANNAIHSALFDAMSDQADEFDSASVPLLEGRAVALVMAIEAMGPAMTREHRDDLITIGAVMLRIARDIMREKGSIDG